VTRWGLSAARGGADCIAKSAKIAKIAKIKFSCSAV
jgi:hypothetical protein